MTQRSGYNIYEITSSGLPQFETSAAYYLTIDQDVDAVDANSKCP